MKTFTLFILIFSSQTLFSQVTFQKTFRITGSDVGVSVLETYDGNYLIYGVSNLAVQNNCFLIKTDANGDSLWGKRYPGYYPYAISNLDPISQTQDNGYIFTTVMLDTTLFIRTNKDGDTLWTVRYNHMSYATFQPTMDGGYILCGLDPTTKLILIKTNNQGHEQWRKFISFFDPVYPYSNRDFSIKQTTDGGYIVSGNSYHDVGAYSFFGYCFLIKANSSGDSLWTKKTDILPLQNFSTIQSTSGNGCIAAGSLDSLTNNGPLNMNGYITKFDENGDPLWSKSYGGSGNQDLHSIQKTSDGGYIACGDNNPDILYGLWGLYLVRTDANGDTLWTKSYPGGLSGTKDILGLYAQETADHGFIACGSKYDSLGNGYVFLMKTDGLGNVYPQGINQTGNTMPLEVFPNPSAGKVYLNLPGKLTSLTVSDMFGRQILQRKIDPTYNNTQIIDLTGNPDGVYLLKVQNETEITQPQGQTALRHKQAFQESHYPKW